MQPEPAMSKARMRFVVSETLSHRGEVRNNTLIESASPLSLETFWQVVTFCGLNMLDGELVSVSIESKLVDAGAPGDMLCLGIRLEPRSAGFDGVYYIRNVLYREYNPEGDEGLLLFQLGMRSAPHPRWLYFCQQLAMALGEGGKRSLPHGPIPPELWPPIPPSTHPL